MVAEASAVACTPVEGSNFQGQPNHKGLTNADLYAFYPLFLSVAYYGTYLLEAVVLATALTSEAVTGECRQ